MDYDQNCLNASINALMHLHHINNEASILIGHTDWNTLYSNIIDLKLSH